MVKQKRLDIQPLTLVAEIAEELCSLPAVATFGWMKRAARTLARLHPDAVTTIALAHSEEDGWFVPRDFAGSIGSRRLSSMIAVVDGLMADLRSDCVREHFADCEEGNPLLGRTNQPRSIFAPTRMILPDRLHPTRMTVLYPMMPAAEAAPRRILCADFFLTQSQERFNATTCGVLEALMPLLGRIVRKAFANVEQTVEISDKEGEVLRLLQQGLTIKQIASELERSPHTVHDHVKSLHRKVGACNRGELLAKTFGLFERSEV